jgi:hypothetical protein
MTLQHQLPIGYVIAAPCNIVDEARKIIISDVLKTNVMAACMPTWVPEIKKLIGTTPTPDGILELGSNLADIFRLTTQAGRGQDSVSGGGAAWEGLVCYYLNLCLIGTNAVVFKKRSTVPVGVQHALTVMYKNVQANTESDLVCVTFPENNPLLDMPLVKKETVWDRLSTIASTQFHELSITVVQCKTNWNDNAQIPMLWDMLYDADTFQSGKVQLGINNRHLRDAAHFSYAFVTVPTNNLQQYKPTSVAVRRVDALTGGNYWGRKGGHGIARSVREIFNGAKMGPSRGAGMLNALQSSLPGLGTKYAYFML